MLCYQLSELEVFMAIVMALHFGEYFMLCSRLEASLIWEVSLSKGGSRCCCLSHFYGSALWGIIYVVYQTEAFSWEVTSSESASRCGCLSHISIYMALYFVGN